MARWLTERFGLTAEDARTRGNEALRGSCTLGRLEVVQWLTERFDLTAEFNRLEIV
jgi:hypothetical protein